MQLSNSFEEERITFDDVAVYFSEEEWKYLGDRQRLLYMDVMMENFLTLHSLDLGSIKIKEEPISVPVNHVDLSKQEMNILLKYRHVEDVIERKQSDAFQNCRESFGEEMSQHNTEVDGREYARIEFTSLYNDTCTARNTTSIQGYSNKDNQSSYILQDSPTLRSLSLCPSSSTPSHVNDPVSQRKTEEYLTTPQEYTDSTMHDSSHITQQFPPWVVRAQPTDLSDSASSLTVPHTVGEMLEDMDTSDHESNVWHEANPSNTVFHNSTTVEKLYACTECGKNFNRSSHLLRHKRIHLGERPFFCGKCGKSFIDSSQLVIHHRTHTGEKPYACNGCEKTFICKLHLVRHQRSHTGERPYVCSICEKGFAQSSNLLTHLRTHTGEKPYSCMHCGKCFIRRSHVVRHQRIHTGEGPYLCTECGKSFTESSALLKHQRSHTGEKPYACTKCQKNFIDKSALANHLRTHTGERPYLCRVCGKSFTHGSALIKHRRIHTGEKPYTCGNCGKSFSQTSALANHERTHTGEKPFSCTDCGKCFTQSSSLVKHQRTHTGERPYSCTECGKSFTYSSVLVKHRRTHNKERLCT
ncbi:zinc finger protein 883 isoform X2 [Bombina bombina]|uniref:zinc finger protein 883 isoform X2 n=1 Tax=Bombina bombina TaxID=8345 RepID=UPI00235A80D0|nr:zinc finger protein 883 isoform X2 [Bombina bombina]